MHPLWHPITSATRFIPYTGVGTFFVLVLLFSSRTTREPGSKRCLSSSCGAHRRCHHQASVTQTDSGVNVFYGRMLLVGAPMKCGCGPLSTSESTSSSPPSQQSGMELTTGPAVDGTRGRGRPHFRCRLSSFRRLWTVRQPRYRDRPAAKLRRAEKDSNTNRGKVQFRLKHHSSRPRSGVSALLIAASAQCQSRPTCQTCQTVRAVSLWRGPLAVGGTSSR